MNFNPCVSFRTVSTTLQAPTVKAAYLVTMAMPPVGLLQTVSPAPARSIFPATSRFFFFFFYF